LNRIPRAKSIAESVLAMSPQGRSFDLFMFIWFCEIAGPDELPQDSERNSIAMPN
jgi:hypothetical protein